MRYEETKYGFNYGPLDIERACSDEQNGWVCISLKTKKQFVKVYVTKSGIIKLYDSKNQQFKV